MFNCILTICMLIFGVDLSHHNKVNIADLPDSIEFVYAKASEGKNFTDKRYKTYKQQCREQNKLFGAYHFWSLKSSGQEQFEHFKKVAGKDLDLIPVLDLEWADEEYNPFVQNKEVKVFIKLCEEYYGVKPIIYSPSKFYLLYLVLDFWDCKYWCSTLANTWFNIINHKAVITQVKINKDIDVNYVKDLNSIKRHIPSH